MITISSVEMLTRGEAAGGCRKRVKVPAQGAVKIASGVGGMGN